MSRIGYYRYKTIRNSNTDLTVTLFINDVPVKTKTLLFVDSCTSEKTLKYLNKDGQYRFFTFNQFFELSDKPELIGELQNFEQGLQETKSSTSVIGYRNSKQYLLTNDLVSKEVLQIFSEIHTSPRVFMYIGDYTSFLDTDYIEVIVKGDGLIRPRKNNFVQVNLTVEIKNQNTIALA